MLFTKSDLRKVGQHQAKNVEAKASYLIYAPVTEQDGGQRPLGITGETTETMPINTISSRKIRKDYYQVYAFMLVLKYLMIALKSKEF